MFYMSNVQFIGKLRVNLVNNLEFLPFDTENRSDECGIPRDHRRSCFVGGIFSNGAKIFKKALEYNF